MAREERVCGLARLASIEFTDCPRCYVLSLSLCVSEMVLLSGLTIEERERRGQVGWGFEAVCSLSHALVSS